MPAFYHSAELRWFLHDHQGRWDQILSWFRIDNRLPLVSEGSYDPKSETRPFLKREAERTDEYLLFPDCDTVGVKQRQGKLEVKALVTTARPYAVSKAGVSGRIDQWVKWSFASQNPRQLDAELGHAGPWRRVVKDRYLQKYSADAGDIVGVSPDKRPDAGCNIELTRISVAPKVWDWLTIGFEAFGPSGRVVAILDQAVEQFFTAHGPAPIALNARDSQSYAAWVASLDR